MSRKPASLSGRCLCGAVRFACSAAPRWVVNCHCDSCRRNCSAPYTTFLGVADGAWRWTGADPAVYRSSPWVQRLFCPTCGSQMAFLSERWPGEIHFYAASLDDPDAVAPEADVYLAEKLSWVHRDDRLTGHEGSG
ncbi:MAG: GFA family protein [Pseudomonadota bacterium]